MDEGVFIKGPPVDEGVFIQGSPEVRVSLYRATRGEGVFIQGHQR